MQGFATKSHLLGVGLDAFFEEKIKTTVKKYKLQTRSRFCESLEKFKAKDFSPAMIILQVPIHFGNALKLVQEILYQYPQSSLIIISPKSDPHLLVHFFRAGAFDVLFTPFDSYELVQALRRVLLKPMEVKSPHDWTPLQAAAHFFTRSITGQWDDLADNIQRYFSLFVKNKEEKIFLIEGGVESFLKDRHRLTEDRVQYLRKFLIDPKALMFGINKQGRRRAWIIKLAPNFICYWNVEFKAEVNGDQVFSTGFINLLRGQRDHYEVHLERERMKLLALTDEITGLWNQRKLTQDLDERVHTKDPFSLLFIDIDFFKSVNDQFGHVHGSQLLIDMAEILRKELRGSDLIYRYGGDEFIVLLPKLDLEQSKITALRLSAAIKQNDFSVQEKPYKMSLSVGIAVYPLDAATAKDLVDFADQMMYMSKKSGRGKVFHMTEVMS